MKPKPTKKDEYKDEKLKIAKRLSNIKDALGYQYDIDFATELGIQKGAYSSIMTGVSALSFRSIMKLSQRYVNFNYLIYGVKTRHGGLLLPISSVKAATVEENEGIYIERIHLLEQENELLKKQVSTLENTIKDKETIISMIQNRK